MIAVPGNGESMLDEPHLFQTPSSQDLRICAKAICQCKYAGVISRKERMDGTWRSTFNFVVERLNFTKFHSAT